MSTTRYFKECIGLGKISYGTPAGVCKIFYGMFTKAKGRERKDQGGSRKTHGKKRCKGLTHELAAFSTFVSQSSPPDHSN